KTNNLTQVRITTRPRTIYSCATSGNLNILCCHEQPFVKIKIGSFSIKVSYPCLHLICRKTIIHDVRNTYAFSQQDVLYIFLNGHCVFYGELSKTNLSAIE